MLFVPLIPHAQVEHDSREEPAFRDAQKEAGSEQSLKIFREAHEGTNDPPYEGESGKPESRGGAFENDIAGYLKQCIASKPDAQCREVLVPGLSQGVSVTSIADPGKKLTHVCVFGKAFDTSVSNYKKMSIRKGDQRE